jgi:hypothetical protein
MRFILISVSFLLLFCNISFAGSLYWTAYSITQHAPNVESSCFNNGSYLSTCNNTNWAYVNNTPVATGTTTSLNYNWNNSSITIGGTNIGNEQRMLVITGYWQHPGTAGQSSTVYFAGRNDDGLIININNTAVVSDWAQQGPTYWNSNGSFTGTGGEWYPITINWYEWGGSANMDIHYRIDGNNATNTTSGWLDMNSDHFALTVTPLSAISTSQTTEFNTFRNKSVNGNQIYINQTGDNNILNILQDGDDNLIIGTDLTSTAVITGDNNNVDIEQLGNDNVLGIDVIGSSNDVDVIQNQDQRAKLSITGSSNTANLNQSGINYVGEHYMSVTIAGNSNILDLDQTETGNKKLFLDIDGSNNVTVDQKGTGDHYSEITLTDSHTVDVTQDGSGDHNATINLSGNQSSVTLTQDSSTSQNYYLYQNCSQASCSATVTQN